MLVLALDTALMATSVAIFDSESGTILAQECLAMERGHAEALVPMVARTMKAAGLSFAKIDRFAVTTGPGSFTGLRIGISAARGFALAHGRPALGVSTLAAFAAPILAGSERVPVAAAVDARHGMIFFQFSASDGRIMAGPGLIALEDAARKLGDGDLVFVGDAAEKLAAAKKGTMPDYRIVQSAIRQGGAPQIEWVARLGATLDPALAPARPLYLREANVTPQMGGRVQRVADET